VTVPGRPINDYGVFGNSRDPLPISTWVGKPSFPLFSFNVSSPHLSAWDPSHTLSGSITVNLLQPNELALFAIRRLKRAGGNLTRRRNSPVSMLVAWACRAPRRGGTAAAPAASTAVCRRALLEGAASRSVVEEGADSGYADGYYREVDFHDGPDAD